MPETTLHSKVVHIGEIMDFPKDAKIFFIQYINRTTLQIFYTTSKPTIDELVKTPYPYGRG